MEKKKSTAEKVGIAGCGITRPEVPPIYATSVFSFETLEDVDAVYEGDKPGYVYSRTSNPTVRLLEEELALLERAERVLAFSSGMAAITTTICSLVKPGDHVLASKVLYGETHKLFGELLPSWGVKVDFVELLETDDIESYFRENTRILYVETISNPLMEVSDIPRLCEEAKKYNCRVVVDNTFATPAFCRPIEEGAHIVLESLTKYLNGHSDVTGGMAGGSAADIETVGKFRTLMGGCMSPFDAWLTLRGLKTFPLRMEKHAENALHLARKLERHPAVQKVFYPGLERNASYGIARKLLRNGFGGMLSFEVAGGEDGVSRLVRNLENVELLPSLAAVKTTLSHPAKTSHRSVPADTRISSGITGGLVRLSAGIETPETVWQDLEKALDELVEA